MNNFILYWESNLKDSIKKSGFGEEGADFG
jgi:hypothetical protein